MARINRSKYNFAKLKVGDTFKVKPIDLHSMNVSLNFFNKKHGRKLELTTKELSDSEVEVAVFSVKTEEVDDIL